MATRTQVLDLARKEIGYREGPRNNENKFGAWYGMNFQAWCAMFLSWVSFFGKSRYVNGAPWRFASTVAARDHAKKNGRWTTIPRVGALAMMAHSSSTGHIGIVESFGNTWVETLEGNTNAQGAREGNGVWRRRRARSEWDGYIVMDYDDGPPPPPPTPAPTITNYPGDKMRSVDFVSPLDSQGNGWVTTPGDAKKLVSVIANGADPLGNGYRDHAMDFEGLQVGDQVKIVVTDGPPAGRVAFRAWFVD